MRLKSEFESLRKRGRFSEPISFVVVLYIINTLVLRKALRAISNQCASIGTTGACWLLVLGVQFLGNATGFAAL